MTDVHELVARIDELRAERDELKIEIEHEKRLFERQLAENKRLTNLIKKGREAMEKELQTQSVAWINDGENWLKETKEFE